MGYFANGTEGENFREQYCYRCTNWGADALSRQTGSDGCPIMDVHVLHGYAAPAATQAILDELIERYKVKDTHDGQPREANRCLMFHLKQTEEQQRQSRSVLPAASAMAPWPVRELR